jgi:hypothetical protein
VTRLNEDLSKERMQLRGRQMTDQTGSAALIGQSRSEATARRQP